MYGYVKFAKESMTLDDAISYVVEKTKLPENFLKKIIHFSSNYRFEKWYFIEIAVSTNDYGTYVCGKTFGSGGIIDAFFSYLFEPDGSLVTSSSSNELGGNLPMYVQRYTQTYSSSKVYTFIPLNIAGYGVFENMYSFPIMSSSLYNFYETECIVNGTKYGVCLGAVHSVIYPITE